MSGNLGPQASTKGETTSKTTSKSGYDRLDINKLYKSKTAEPVAKQITQKHGMQTLGKAPPARRAGASIVKPENSNDTSSTSVPPTQQQQPTSGNLGQPGSQQQKWTNSASPHPPGPPSLANMPSAHPPGHHTHDKGWVGGSESGGNYQSQRFAQEFPSLDAGEPTKASSANSNQQLLSGQVPGHQISNKLQDNTYGPGPILRPQTEGSWTQGGGRGSGRPPGPPAQNQPVKDPGPDRPNLGGPTPPPMSLGQGGPAPPPLGYPMQQQYRGMAPFMYPNAGPPPGQGFFPPPGSGMPRYGMQVPPGAPPPSGGPRDSSENSRDSNRGRHPPHPTRPMQQFAVKPILKQEDLKRMDEIDQEGTWASVRDDVDYNKRISFSDDDGEEKQPQQREPGRKLSDHKNDKERSDPDRKPVRILERQTSSNEREQHNRYDQPTKEHMSNNELDNEDEWNKRRSNNNANYDSKDRSGRRGRDSRDEDWRGGNARFEDDPRGKKGPPVQRLDTRGPQDFGNKQYSNLPPRLQRQQQHSAQPTFSGNQRKTPSPVSASGKERERDYQRDRDWDKERGQAPTQYRILERNRGDSESSNTSCRDKRSSISDQDLRPFEKESMKRSPPSDDSKEKDFDSSKEKDKKSDYKKSDDNKLAFRTSKPGFTSSWAEEVEDDDYSNREYEDIKKYTSANSKPEAIKAEERTVPKRVYIQQRKVENMTLPAPKQESQPEPKNTVEAPKQEKVSERPRSTAWGEREREGREKFRGDSDGVNLSQEDDKDRNSDNHSRSSEREIILSEKAQQLIHSKEESIPDTSEERNISHEEKPVKEYDKRGSKDLDNDKGRDRYGHSKSDSRRDVGGYTNRGERPRQGGRWGTNENRRDNKTPERDVGPLNRSHASDNTGPSNRASQAEMDSNRNIGNDRNRTELVKESSPGTTDQVPVGDGNEKDNGKPNDYDRPRERDSSDKRYRNNDDSELDNRGNPKNIRGGRERSGHGVYQPRGSWGRQESRGRGRGGGREHYDNRARKNDYERERDDHRNSKSERDGDIRKEKVTEKDVTDEAASKVPLSDEERIKKDKESGGSGEPTKKASKSPQSNKRNMTKGGGGTRLQGYQGYGAPSDTPPFSSHSSSKEEDKDKGAELTAKSSGTPSITGPIPLMDLVDISPPTMPPRTGRHHNAGGRGSRGGTGGGERGGMQHRNEPYSSTYNRGGSSKRGRGDAKPLMSISSNDLERNDHDTGSESGTEDDGKKSQAKSKKDSVTVSSDSTSLKGVSDDGENVESENQQLSEQSKKGSGGVSKEKTGSNSSLKNDKSSTQQQNQASSKDRKVRNPPYEARPSATNKEVPPRFQRQQQGPPQSQQYPASKQNELANNSLQKDGPSSNAWESKPAVGNTSTKPEQNLPTPVQPASNENKDTPPIDQKLPISAGSGGSQGISAINSSSILDSSGGPLKTMIFENRNFKSGSVNTNSAPKTTSGNAKLNEPKKEASIAAPMEIPKDLAQVFGKGVTEERSADLDFVSAFDEQHNNSHSQVPQSMASSQQHGSTKPLPIGQGSRAYPPHLPSPISPMSMELDKKIKGVSVLWEPPTMPSVAEQTAVSGTDESTFHSSFGNDSHSLKSSDTSSREFSASLTQPTSYAPGSSPALASMSAISKPESSTSPNASHIRQVNKPQQQSNMENPNHVTGMSSSPFAFSMSQHHQGNSFGGISAVPSPPTVLYGASQAMHTGPGMYQTFPQHVEASQVMNTGARSQFGQYSNPQGGGGGGQYGIGASIFMASMDAGYQPMTGFQHSHQQQHSQSGPPGQAPSQNSRISPGPLTSSGGGANVSGVVMNSSSMKSQQGGGGHPNMQHQHQVMQGGHNQQGYSQMNHHHSGGMGHHQHAVGPVGPAKAPSYTQSGMGSQSQPQLYIPAYDPSSQSVINLGQNYMPSGIRSAPGPTGPPPPATPPVQTLQPSSTYYSGNASNQVYHGGSNQGGNLQQLHVAVGPNPQALQNLQTATQQFGMQFQSPMNLQGYNQQAATTVSALNLGGQLIRQGPPGHSHYSMKQQGMDLVQQQQMKSHESMMNQSWNTQGFSVNQGFHSGNKPGGGNVDRNSGNNIGNQRKGSHQSHQMGNLSGMKYVHNSGGGGGYPGHSGQKGGRYAAPGPIQRPVSTSPSTGPPVGSMNNMPPSMSIPIGVKSKHMAHHDPTSKHLNQPNSLTEEGLLDKLITTEAGQRSISGTPDSSKMIVSGGRLVDNRSNDRKNGNSDANLKNPGLNIAPTNKSPIGSSNK